MKADTEAIPSLCDHVANVVRDPVLMRRVDAIREEISAPVRVAVVAAGADTDTARLRDAIRLAAPAAEVLGRAAHEMPAVPDADAVVIAFDPFHPEDVATCERICRAVTPRPSRAGVVLVLADAPVVAGGAAGSLDRVQRLCDGYIEGPLRRFASAAVALDARLATAAFSVDDSDIRALRTLAMTPAGELDDMLASASRFIRVNADDPLADLRRRLITRLGLYGVRVAIDAERKSPGRTEFADVLRAASGFGALTAALSVVVERHGAALQAERSFNALLSVAQTHARSSPSDGNDLAEAVTRAASRHIGVLTLRLCELISAADDMRPADLGELGRLTSEGGLARQLGFEHEASSSELLAAAATGVERWRNRSASPLSSRAEMRSAEALVRWYEAVCAALV